MSDSETVRKVECIKPYGANRGWVEATSEIGTRCSFWAPSVRSVVQRDAQSLLLGFDTGLKLTIKGGFDDFMYGLEIIEKVSAGILAHEDGELDRIRDSYREEE